MATRVQVWFMTLPSGQVIAVYRDAGEPKDHDAYRCYPHVEASLGGSPAAWSARPALAEEYAPVQAMLEALGWELELCDELAGTGGIRRDAPHHRTKALTPPARPVTTG